jgi:hypothetical protein
MAVGFPTKTSYANGDVFSASDINDTNGTLNLVNPATTPTVQANPVLNSAFQIWQRGTASTAIGTTGTPFFLADRWQAVRGGFAAGGSVSRQVTNDTTNLPFIQYCMRVQRDNLNASTASLVAGQNLESVNSIPFAGKTVTLSYYARAGANYSPTSSILRTYLITGTGTDQNAITGSFTGSVNAINNQPATLTTSWQRFTFTATLASSITQINLQLIANVTGVAGANDFFEYTGVQIDIGSVALPFRTYAGTIQGELAACQRYYYRSTSSAGSQTSTGISGITNSTTNLVGYFNPPVSMRVTPTAVDFSSIGTQTTASGLTAISAVAIVNESTNNSVSLNLTSSGFLANLFGLVRGTTGTGYIGLSAEL